MQDIEGVYSRMYRAMDDHKQGLISFEDMLRLWKEEARMIREQSIENYQSKDKQAA